MVNLQVKQGITENQRDQLLKFTHSDPQIAKFTSDLSRFKDKTSALKWLDNVRVYTLTDKANNLIGLAWFHRKPLPEREFIMKLNSSDFPLTFGIRIYGKARGKGLSFDFMKKSFESFKPGSIWIQTSFDNLPTIKLAEKFGFKKVSEPDARGKIIMILDPSMELRASKPE